MTPQNEPQEVNMINQQAFENWAMDQGDSPHRLLVGRAWARAWHAACAYKALTPSPETELRAEVERDVENAYPILSRRNLALRANLEAAELDLRATKARAEAAEARVKELEEDRSRLRIARHDYETTLTAETKKREEAEAMVEQLGNQVAEMDEELKLRAIGFLPLTEDDPKGVPLGCTHEEAQSLVKKALSNPKEVSPTNSPITGSKLVVPPEVATVAKSATVPPEVVEKVVEALKALEQMVLSGRDHSCSFKIADEALALVEKVRSSSKPSSVVMEKGQS